jgi:hypothetical protein
MYATCLFCNAGLGTNEVIERFPVGKRLAFDPGKGRLWVVCDHCQRWNLTPMEERFEAVEECERLFRGTLVRVSTDNIGLAVLRSGLDLVRIGAPLRPEFAAWRYGGQFARRFNRSRVMKGAAVVGSGLVSGATGVAMWPVLLLDSALYWQLIPAILPIMAAVPMVGVLGAFDYVQNERIVARFARGGRLLSVRARHAAGAQLAVDGDGTAELRVSHDDGVATFDGTEAIHAATVILANSNREGGDKRVVDDAVSQIEASGSVEGFLAAASNRGERRRTRVLFGWGKYRGLGALNLSLTERLALEMAVHEETERRAMDGELAILEEAWRGAEEIAAICDGLLTPVATSS